jgi:hypothetical protein
VCGDVPEEHGLVAAYTDEAVVVLRNAYVVYFVAMGAVFLHFEAGGWIEEADLSVGATGQELRWWRSGVCLVVWWLSRWDVRIGLIRRCSRERALGLLYAR